MFYLSLASARSYTHPLAQLVDLLPDWGWYALLAGGMLAPLVGLAISLSTNNTAGWKRRAVSLYYIVAVLVAGSVFVFQTENPLSICSFMILMPLGMLLGLIVMVPSGRAAEQRGFEVEPNRDDKPE